MEATTKAVRRRLSVLKLAATRPHRRWMDRTSFNEWKLRFETPGFEGLKDLPRRSLDRHHELRGCGRTPSFKLFQDAIHGPD